MLLGGLVSAVGMAFLVSFLLSGPKLGPHYDLLSSQKKPVISREILIIESDEYIEGIDFFNVLMTLTEMEASNLILTGRLSPSATPITVTEADLRRRFIDEYVLVGSNIRNLFEGIRMGSISPVQAPVLVERLVELTERGRDRLISALIDRDEELLRSVAVFGNFQDAYTAAYADNDGKLRRVKPIDHPMYEYIRMRYSVSQIETSLHGQVLWLRSHDGQNMDIMLDTEGYIITLGNLSFRRINIDLFKRYEELSSVMLAVLEEINEIGAFSKTPPEKIPLFLGQYSNVVLEDLIRSPDNDSRSAWISSRAVYLAAVEDFLNSQVGLLFINEYEEQIADTDSSDSLQLASLIQKRDELKQVFSLIQEIYSELSAIYDTLKEELAMSLCIMGPQLNAEYSALLANALITGSHVKPVSDLYALIWSIAAAFLVIIIIFMMRPSVLLITGLVLSLIIAAIFSGLFIVFSFWVDPVITLLSSFTGILVVFLCKLIYLNYRAHSFRMAYKTAVPKNVLQSLIEAGKPDLLEVHVTSAVVIAIKDINLFGRESREKSKDAGKIKKNFFSMAKKALFNAGAVIAGFEGDTILACFGSPLEIQPRLTTHKWSDDGKPLAKSYHPADKACALVRQLLRNDKISWRFGIDFGECSFSWSPETGFSVNGSPAVRARVLVSRNARFNTRALITNSVKEKLNIDCEEIGTLYNDADFIYELN